MTTELTFVDASYIPPTATSGGRAPDPNPFLVAVAAIALKTDPKTTKPVAKAFTFYHDGSDADIVRKEAKFKRQLSAAGNTCEPPVTVRSALGTVNATTSTLTFWTIPKIIQGSPEVTTTATTEVVNPA